MESPRSLPTNNDDDMDSDQSSVMENDGFYPYVIRFTPYEKYSRADVEAWLRETFPMQAWVLGKEDKPRVHYHIVLNTDHDDVKKACRDFLYKYWPEDERKRGWGNKQWNCMHCEDEDQAVSYAVKEGDYTFDVYDPEYMKERVEASFKKKEKTFKEELMGLEQLFIQLNMDIRTYMILFAQLKAKHNQMINVTHVYGYALSALIRRNPTEAENIVEDFLYKQ